MSEIRNLLNKAESMFLESLDNPSAKEREMDRLGWERTGHYDFIRDKVVAAQKRPEFKGYKTKVVRIPHSKLSRGGPGNGYGLYAEPAYFEDKREREEIQRKEREIAQLKNERETIKARLKEIDQILGSN